MNGWNYILKEVVAMYGNKMSKHFEFRSLCSPNNLTFFDLHPHTYNSSKLMEVKIMISFTRKILSAFGIAFVISNLTSITCARHEDANQNPGEGFPDYLTKVCTPWPSRIKVFGE